MEWGIIWEFRDHILAGLRLTLWLTGFTIFGGFFVGTIIGCFGAIPGFLYSRLKNVYCESLRNVPIVVKLFFFYFLFGFDAIPACIISLILHQSSYIADVVAAGIRSVPREQEESALVCAFTYPQIFIYIILPQAFRIIIPPMTSQFIEALKNTSIVMLIAVEELTWQTQYVEHQTWRGFEVSTAVTVFYALIALSIVGLMNTTQKLLDRK